MGTKSDVLSVFWSRVKLPVNIRLKDTPMRCCVYTVTIIRGHGIVSRYLHDKLMSERGNPSNHYPHH